MSAASERYSVKMYGVPLAVRFWAKVSVKGDNECWEWMAGKDKDGYGRFRYGRQKARSNKVAWIIANGPIPEGLWVLHHCDNPSCVNPKHLYLGTNKENCRDRAERGRGFYKKGENAYTKGVLTKGHIRRKRELEANSCLW